MGRRPSRENKLCLAIRSKVYIPERMAVEVVQKVLDSGYMNGDVPEMGLRVQCHRGVRNAGTTFYIREIKRVNGRGKSAVD